jgi:LysM repeat protein
MIWKRLRRPTTRIQTGCQQLALLRTGAIFLCLLLLGLSLALISNRSPARQETPSENPSGLRPSGRSLAPLSTPVSPRLQKDEGPADELLPGSPALGEEKSEAQIPVSRGQGGSLADLNGAPAATLPSPRQEVITYTVQEGDNVWDIAQRFSISPETIVWANDQLEIDPDFLSVAQELVILPVSGVWHTVKPGDTLESIAKRYNVTVQAIVDYEPNSLKEPYNLSVGQRLIIPNGEQPFEPRLVYAEKGPITVNARPEVGRFIWPTSGYLTQYFSRQHPAIDIANAEGTPILAATAGVVTFVGWYGTMGNAIFIDHGNGYVTWYAHLRACYPKVGQRVQQGEVIGEMGNTGKSTGPHLHFAIQYLGGAVNPIRYLPPLGR